jgi:hypothetical protein
MRSSQHQVEGQIFASRIMQFTSKSGKFITTG